MRERLGEIVGFLTVLPNNHRMISLVFQLRLIAHICVNVHYLCRDFDLNKNAFISFLLHLLH